MIQPKLLKTNMSMAMKDGTYEVVPVELWSLVGLAAHTWVRGDDYLTFGISHFDSGLLVLGNLMDRKEACTYLKKLYDIRKDWYFNAHEFMQTDEYQQLKKKVEKLKAQHEKIKT